VSIFAYTSEVAFLEVFVIGGKVVAITLISLIAPIDEGLTQAIASYIARIKRLLFILHVLAISIFLYGLRVPPARRGCCYRRAKKSDTFSMYKCNSCAVSVRFL
jgi:hypothetical protein